MIHLFLEFTLVYWYVWVILLLFAVITVGVGFDSEMLFVVAEAFSRGFVKKPKENPYKRFIFNCFLYFSVFMAAALIFAVIAKFLAPYW